MASGTPVATDLVQPFQVERAELGGRFVRLGPLLTEILNRHDYPDSVAQLLAEAVTLTALLASTLKYEGVFSLQASGEGPVSLLVADQTSSGELRGYARFDEEALAADLSSGESDRPLVRRLLGNGYLAFTADPGGDKEPYQGIVALEGNSLTDCAHHYFRQSEQIAASIRLEVRRNGVSGKPGEGDVWQAGAIMIRRLPGEGPFSDRREPEAEDAWQEAAVLMQSAQSDELADPALLPHQLLYRLFNEPGVRVFAPRGLAAGCRCSRERVSRTLTAFPRDEILALAENGKVEVRCEFCGTLYHFDVSDLDASAVDGDRRDPPES